MAGFFGLFDYSKPGKGVRKDEPKRSRFVHFFVLLQRKFWKIIQLNLLFILFCLPVITIGPAITGMIYVLRNYVNEQPVFLFSDFWDAFKGNWKQSVPYSILLAAIAAILVVSGQFYMGNAQQHTWMYLPVGMVFLMGMLAIFATYYVYLMIVTLDLPLKSIIKNGLILAIVRLKTNFITLFILAAIGAASLFFPGIAILVYLFIGFALIGFIVTYNAYPGIQKYVIDPFLEAQEGREDPEEEDETLFQDEYQREKED